MVILQMLTHVLFLNILCIFYSLISWYQVTLLYVPYPQSFSSYVLTFLTAGTFYFILFNGFNWIIFDFNIFTYDW